MSSGNNDLKNCVRAIIEEHPLADNVDDIE